MSRNVTSQAAVLDLRVDMIRTGLNLSVVASLLAFAVRALALGF